MVQRFFQQVSEPGRSVNFERDYVSIDDISPNLINAVAISEDGGLYMYHHGFAYKNLKKAYINARAGKERGGGSTISQQTAKNCFLPHTRSVWRKAVEAYYTVLIEAVWGKKRCLPTPLRSNPAHPSRYLSGRASTIQHRMGYYGKIDFEKKREELNPKYLKMVDEDNLFTFISWMIEYNREHPSKKK